MATILVVDDDADHCEVLGRILERAGHHTFCADNGWEALVTLDRSNIDLIVLDLMMPGMDGPTFLSILRNDRRHHDIPVIVLTALHDTALAARARRLGVNAVIPKTRISFTDILEDVEQALANSAAASANAQLHVNPGSDPGASNRPSAGAGN